MALLYESSSGNLVDGLPLALVQKLLGAHGVLGPAPIGIFDLLKSKKMNKFVILHCPNVSLKF